MHFYLLSYLLVSRVQFKLLALSGVDIAAYHGCSRHIATRRSRAEACVA